MSLVPAAGSDYRLASVAHHPYGNAIMIGSFLELGLVALWIAVGSGQQRRSHFWLRFFAASLALPSFIAALVGMGPLLSLPDGLIKAVFPVLFILGILGLMLVPGLLYRRTDSSPGESDGGGGPGPSRPDPVPPRPRGGIPLPDADESSARARDHSGPRFDYPERRRPAHAPARRPARTTSAA